MSLLEKKTTHTGQSQPKAEENHLQVITAPSTFSRLILDSYRIGENQKKKKKAREGHKVKSMYLHFV